MSATIANTRDHKTEAIVLRRVNYGEADRILDLLTPAGIVPVLAKSVRKEKSRLAGGIELFCLSEITYHEGRSGLATLTGAKMLKFYNNLLSSFEAMNLASLVLKQVSRVAASAPSPDYFALTRDILEALNSGLSPALAELYFHLNLAAISGEEPNFRFDVAGHKLSPEATYMWDISEQAFAEVPNGPFGADDIKFLRLILASSLTFVSRVRYPAERIPLLLAAFRP